MSVVQLCVASVQNTHAVISGVHLGEKKKWQIGLKMLRISNVQKSVQSMGKTFCYLKKYR